MSTTALNAQFNPHDAPSAVTQSAWACRYRERFLSPSNVLFALSFPLIFLGALWYLWYVLAMVHPLSPSEASGAPIQWFCYSLFVWTLHSGFVLYVLVYVLDVLSLVPWSDRRYPLIDQPQALAYMPITGRNYLIVMVCALLGSGPHVFASLHTWLIAMEGLFIVYLRRAQPAFGFVPWKRCDQEALNAQLRQRGTRRALAAPVADQDDDTYQVSVVAQAATLNFSTIFGMSSVKEKLLAPAQRVIASQREEGEAPRNGFLLYGEPGNGKTVFAQGLAGELGVPLIVLTYGDVSSQWMGNMPKVLSKTFAYASRCAPCVLFIDEIDSFIPSRDRNSNNAEDAKITNTLLTEIVNLRESRVVLMGATNYLSLLDAAAVREGRFDFKVEIPPPDEEARIGLIQAGVSRYAPGLRVDAKQARSVAVRWNGFSVARLMAVCKALPDVATRETDTFIGLAQWMMALREVQGASGASSSDAKPLSDLVLERDCADALHLIARRLKDVARLEALGGSLPAGVLLYGPSGTGKTAAARALAREVGWAFLTVAGAELLSDRTRLDKLYAQAKDLRPTLIFIDEADDVLRNRQYSPTPELTNKLLMLMDGANEKVRDVVWVAATNHPEQIDPALLRSGRFSEKIGFSAPPLELLAPHVSRWLKVKGVKLQHGLDAFEVAADLHGCTIADIEGVLQYALNCAISSSLATGQPQIGRNDLIHARRVVLCAEG